MSSLEVTKGADYKVGFPMMGRSPELEMADGPVAMLVYQGAYPGRVFWNPNHAPTEPRSPAPGTADICAILPDGERVIYLNVSLEGFVEP